MCGGKTNPIAISQISLMYDLCDVTTNVCTTHEVNPRFIRNR